MGYMLMQFLSMKKRLHLITLSFKEIWFFSMDQPIQGLLVSEMLLKTISKGSTPPLISIQIRHFFRQIL